MDPMVQAPLPRRRWSPQGSDGGSSQGHSRDLLGAEHHQRCLAASAQIIEHRLHLARRVAVIGAGRRV
jgi:hypothetical protein